MKRCFFPVILAALLVLSIGLQAGTGYIDKPTIENVKQELLKQHGEQCKFRIERGVEQTAQFWTKEDGSPEVFAGFCKKMFIGSPEKLDVFFKRMETYSEIISGYFTEMSVDLKQALHLDWGEILPVDMLMGQYSPSAHLSEDFFKNKLSFLVLLNFPQYSLEEKMKLGEKWSRKEWAYVRSGGETTSRVPASVSQEISKALTVADTYISQYNIYMGKLVDNKMNSLFPEKLKLISHWGLRDELKARYSDKNGLDKQKMIYKIMLRIINQDIPEKVVNNPAVQWNPFTNKVFENGKEIDAPNEPDTRYKMFLNIFKSIKKSDPFSPSLPTHVKRMFDSTREIPESDVEALFKELLASPEVKKVAKLIRKRVKRKLQPFDIWYAGFKGNVSISEEDLNKKVRAKYPDGDAFQKGIPEILVKLGFPKERAKFIASRIRVDAARGAGHCIGSAMKSARARLRTRVPKEGMDYKGFNIAVHELGHAVEQTLTLHDVDYYPLIGVPNTAFTEAFAFVFQDRDLELLGIEQDNEAAKHLKALDVFWNAYEIMGVSLVDMKAWNWMYAHPEATPAELKNAVITIAKDIWNQYYAPIFKIKDQPILAIYSHMIDSALYLPDYPLGHVIQFQIEKYLEGKEVAPEMERMCKSGNIIPQLWMKNAVGSKISVKPLLESVSEAVKHIKK
jgi:hypothetical protein